jgi:hypothetical protein
LSSKLRNKSIFVIAALVALSGVAAACTIVDSLKLPDTVSDGGPTPVVEASTKDAYVDPCRSTGVPGPPDPPVGAGPGGSTYFFAVDTVAFSGGGDAGAPVGLNLDSECTCSGKPPDPQSCVPLSANNRNCDILGAGIDNAVALLVNGQAKQGGYDVEGISQRALAKGRSGLLIKIDQYNDQPNDSHVVFSFYVSGGPALPDGGGVGTMTPTFTTADQWTVDVKGLVGGADPKKYVSLNNTGATVTDGVFVAPNLSGVLRLDTNLTLDLKSMMLTGKLVKDPAGGYRIDDGVLAGRWTTSDALRNLGNLGDPTADGGKVCENPLNYAALMGLVCASADISSTGPDNTNVTCDALSLGLRFTAKPATFGAVTDVSNGTTGCAAADTQCKN